jgi:hypothetical protein
MIIQQLTAMNKPARMKNSSLYHPLRKSNQAHAENHSKQSTNIPKAVHQGKSKKSRENPKKNQKSKDHPQDIFWEPLYSCNCNSN